MSSAICPRCFESHRLTGICGEDAAELADEYAAQAVFLRGLTELPAVERYVLGFARQPEERLTDEQCVWFEELTRINFVNPAAEVEFTKRGTSDAPVVTGTWVGTVGERRLMTLTVTSIRSLGVGEFGESFLCKMKDVHGNEVVWFTGENLALDEGITYTVKATVVEHTEFQSRRQTRVNRLKVQTEGV